VFCPHLNGLIRSARPFACMQATANTRRPPRHDNDVHTWCVDRRDAGPRADTCCIELRACNTQHDHCSSATSMAPCAQRPIKRNRRVVSARPNACATSTRTCGRHDSTAPQHFRGRRHSHSLFPFQPPLAEAHVVALAVRHVLASKSRNEPDPRVPYDDERAGCEPMETGADLNLELAMLGGAAAR